MLTFGPELEACAVFTVKLPTLGQEPIAQRRQTAAQLQYNSLILIYIYSTGLVCRRRQTAAQLQYNSQILIYTLQVYFSNKCLSFRLMLPTQRDSIWFYGSPPSSPSPSLSLWLALSISVFLCLCLCLYFSVLLCLFMSVSVSFCLSLSFCLCLSVSVFLSLSFSVEAVDFLERMYTRGSRFLSLHRLQKWHTVWVQLRLEILSLIYFVFRYIKIFDEFKFWKSPKNAYKSITKTVLKLVMIGRYQNIVILCWL